jgi:hypothetical protein
MQKVTKKNAKSYNFTRKNTHIKHARRTRTHTHDKKNSAAGVPVEVIPWRRGGGAGGCQNTICSTSKS